MKGIDQMKLAAYFYPASADAKRQGVGGYLSLEVIESTGERHKMISDRPMSGKREARQVALAHGYAPWNF